MTTRLKKIVIIGLSLIVLAILLLVVSLMPWPTNPQPTTSPTPILVKASLPKFSSCQKLAETLKKNQAANRTDVLFEQGMPSANAPSLQKEVTPDYSTTNIQVAGVDEADIIKTDGEYVYSVVKNKTIVIARAFPPDQMEITAKINNDEKSNDSIQEIYLENNRLVVIGNYYQQSTSPSPSPQPMIYPPIWGNNITFLAIYSLQDKKNPELLRRLEFEGSYLSSRKIDHFAYLVLNSYPNYQLLTEDLTTLKEDQLIPKYNDQKGKEISADKKFAPICQCADIEYFDPIKENNFINLIALDINNEKADPDKETVVGQAQNVYSSLKNIFIANTDYLGSSSPLNLSELSNEITNIYKFNLNQNQVNFQINATVPGNVLNQFSMDEDNDYFRIATTKGHVGREESSSSNNIYILDANLKKVGQIENIAPGEKIYSARFMGKKGYLVTFKKIDPFFTIDLSDPQNPKILGKLKIPGYSDYLHPYDENHIIGLGKNSVEGNDEGTFAWYQGIKIALFDVSNFANPKEIAKTEIGDRGTDSYALSDHKAFLFDKNKELLVIPILLAEIPSQIKNNPNSPANTYGTETFQGAYVWRLTLDKGFEFKGRITHRQSNEELTKNDYYYYQDNSSVKRSLYIKDILYTFSDEKLLANKLDNLEKIKEINWAVKANPTPLMIE
jgi:uncharacterized secreted protein with C-terminal beta-propeller domain